MLILIFPSKNRLKPLKQNVLARWAEYLLDSFKGLLVQPDAEQDFLMNWKHSEIATVGLSHVYIT